MPVGEDFKCVGRVSHGDLPPVYVFHVHGSSNFGWRQHASNISLLHDPQHKHSRNSIFWSLAAGKDMPSFMDVAGGRDASHSFLGMGSQRTLGPCAETMGMTTGVAFWLAVAQLPVMMGLALHYPTVRIDMFTIAIRLTKDPATNETAIAYSNASAVYAAGYEHGLGISGLYVLSSASFTFFAVLTMNFLERGVASVSDEAGHHMRHALVQQMGGEEFVLQNVGMVVDPAFRMWNQVCTVLVVCNPMHCLETRG